MSLSLRPRDLTGCRMMRQFYFELTLWANLSKTLLTFFLCAHGRVIDADDTHFRLKVWGLFFFPVASLPRLLRFQITDQSPRRIATLAISKIETHRRQAYNQRVPSPNLPKRHAEPKPLGAPAPRHTRHRP